MNWYKVNWIDLNQIESNYVNQIKKLMSISLIADAAVLGIEMPFQSCFSNMHGKGISGIFVSSWMAEWPALWSCPEKWTVSPPCSTTMNF